MNGKGAKFDQPINFRDLPATRAGNQVVPTRGNTIRDLCYFLLLDTYSMQVIETLFSLKVSWTGIH